MNDKIEILTNIISYSNGTVLVNKSNLSLALELFADDLQTCGDDDFQDRYFNNSISKRFEITEDDKTVQITFVTDTSENSITTSTWDSFVFFMLKQYFQVLKVTFSYAYLDLYKDMTLYFKSDPKSFEAFKKGIILDNVKLELDPKSLAQPSNPDSSSTKVSPEPEL